MNRPRSSPTIRDVARACGVSPMTVSFVLNHKRGQVGEETRARVLKAVRELGYRPGALERKNEANPIWTLGLVAGVDGLSLLQEGYYSMIVNEVILGADALGHNLTLFTNTLMHQEPQRSVRVYCDGRCDGLLVLAPHTGSPLIAALEERGFPFVLIGSTGSDETAACVDIDNIAAGFSATEYLIRHGHRRIGFGGGPEFVQSSGLRQTGYRNALRAHDLPVNPEWEFFAGMESSITEWVYHLLQSPLADRPTAFFMWNDLAAVNALDGVRQAGLRVPQDVSILGLDDMDASRTSVPPLTTFRQPYEQIGRRAVEILLDLLNPDSSVPRRELLPTQLIERESVAPPNG